MAQHDLLDSMRLTWEITPTGFPESMQFSIHTGLRDDADWTDLFTAMSNIAVNMQTIQAPCTYTRYVLSAWGTGPGFTGWHQLAAQTPSYTAGGGDMMPHQLAVVVGLRNNTELGVALGRRRNRFYFGPLRAAGMDTSGRTTTSLQTSLQSVVTTMQSELEAVPAGAGWTPDFDGLCVASPTEDVLMEATVAVVGRAYDTQRSRRQKVPETPTFVAL